MFYKLLILTVNTVNVKNIIHLIFDTKRIYCSNYLKKKKNDAKIKARYLLL